MAQSWIQGHTHRKAWLATEVLGHYGLQYDIQAMIALNGSPAAYAQAIIELESGRSRPASALAREKNRSSKKYAAG